MSIPLGTAQLLPERVAASGAPAAVDEGWIFRRRRKRRMITVASTLMTTLLTIGDHIGGRLARPRRNASASRKMP
jgi:hypothetical protein